MQVLTIPKQIVRDDLVIIPRKYYEGLLRSSRSNVDPDIAQSLQELDEGKAVGPFRDAKSLMRSLLGTK